MLKKDEPEHITVNPKIKRSFTLKPAAHLYEVDAEQYYDGKLIRSTFEKRLLDTYLFFSGGFFRDTQTDEIIGGKTGLLDFIIPHYFLYRAWMWWSKNPTRAYAGFIITIPLAMITYTLGIIKIVLSFLLSLVSTPFIGLTHWAYLEQYLELKQSIKNLMITIENPTDIEDTQNSEAEEVSVESTKNNKPLTYFSFKEAFIDTKTYQAEKHVKKYPHLIEAVPSFRSFFSNMNSKISLIEDNNKDLYIKVSKPPETQASTESHYKNKVFFIKVDAENSEPLQQALHLNIFGITTYLENHRNSQNQPYIELVQEALVSKEF